METHIRAINRGDFRSAYGHFASQYRDRISFEEFHSSFADYVSQLPGQSLKFSHVETNGLRALVEGLLTGKDGAVIPIHYELVKEKGEWRIRNFQWTQPGELISL